MYAWNVQKGGIKVRVWGITVYFPCFDDSPIIRILFLCVPTCTINCSSQCLFETSNLESNIKIRVIRFLAWLITLKHIVEISFTSIACSITHIFTLQFP